MELVQVLEDRQAPHPYVIWSLQVDCATGALRAEDAGSRDAMVCWHADRGFPVDACGGCQAWRVGGPSAGL